MDRLKADGKTTGTIVMINGAPTDNNATLFKGSALGHRRQRLRRWAPSTTRRTGARTRRRARWSQALTAAARTGFVGVFAADDGTAGGAISSMKGGG